MPQEQWTKKEERQYKHIRDQAEDRGTSHDRAEEIAARTVNKERARKGETKTASRTSIQDMSSSKRGGQRSGKRTGPKGRTKDQLYEDAKRENIKGRSKMNKAELKRALERKK
ncbi:MAG TPA: plasmid stabilization protein [Glycomyces sp.]|nr:plasmid stabilization protein [Glycomyces sp.]